MTGSRSKDDDESSPPSGDAPLFTSDDLFGDMVDEPLADSETQPVVRPARKDPIRVQISEPDREHPHRVGGPKKPSAPSEMHEANAEEVAALLDVLGPDPSVPESAPRPPLASPPPAPRPAAPKPAPAPTRPPAPRVPPPSVAPPRPPAAPSPFELDVPTPTARTATRFTAAPPKPKVPESPALDLAAVAEDAIGTKDHTPTGVSVPFNAPRATPPAGAKMYGPYRLLERVAVGGMAEVFRAKLSGVEGFEKMVAVKRILPHLSDNKEFVDMFINEAKMVAGLTHPNIVQIFDLGRIEKTYYIAMEYVHGCDLRSIMKRAKERGARIPMDLSVLIIGEVCSALEYAHRKKDNRGRPLRIVHRDVSPQNILISYEGDVKLTDFGIAKAAARAPTTDRGALRGKLLYMSPEQANGRPMDCRSDVFSLGICFYEMVTDQRPFQPSSDKSILEIVRECRVVPPSAINSRVPERLEKIIMRALARDPDDRYNDASDVYKDLERFLRERQSLTQVELARFMEVLFDDTERRATIHDEPTNSGEHRSGPIFDDLEMEFEPEPTDDPPGTPVQSLLKKFGLK